jgi:hypothetical protein
LADDRRTPEAPPQTIPALENAHLEPVNAGPREFLAPI